MIHGHVDFFHVLRCLLPGASKFFFLLAFFVDRRLFRTVLFAVYFMPPLKQFFRILVLVVVFSQKGTDVPH